MTNPRRAWRGPSRTIVLATLFVATGYWLGFTEIALITSLSLVLLYWSLQLYRVDRWLDHSEDVPPDATGVWGRLYDHIYRLQRQRKETLGRLESSVEYLQDSLKSLRDAAIIIDPRGNISWVNDSAGILLGIELSDDIGRPLVNLVRSPLLSDYLASSDYQWPLRLEPTPEQERCLQLEVTSFAGGDRLIFVKDISEQYKLEMMRRDFVGNVSHELRTPLTVLKGYVENLQSLDSDLTAVIDRPLAQMEMQVNRMEVLLKDLLWLSRIESIENSDKTMSIDMGELVTEIVDDLRTAWPERSILLIQEYRGLVLGDPMELHSAVSNLIVNALKYSDPQSEITVEWVLDDARPSLNVSDQGDGIEPIHIPRLTERFYRVDKSRSQVTGGTGLGLAIVKHVALAHNAELLIESEINVGSTFSIVFSSNE